MNAPQSEMRRGDRQRIPRDESPKTRPLCERDRGFESISLQRRVWCEPDFLDSSWRRRLKEDRHVGDACVAFGGAARAIMAYVLGIFAKIALTTIGVTLPSVIYVISNAVVSEINRRRRRLRLHRQPVEPGGRVCTRSSVP